MPYSVKILADSLAPCNKRLTTFELTYPRFVHSELLTHRLFSRNSSSSRAIPNEKLIEMIKKDPAMPVFWGKNQPGMQSKEEFSFADLYQVKAQWLEARDKMLEYSEKLANTGLHKQLCNRIIEPWMFITVIVSATEYSNWFGLRCHKDAQPELKFIADEMKKQYDSNDPIPLKPYEWHMPLIYMEDWDTVEDEGKINAIEILKKVSVGRCARVSYLTHDGKRDLAKDIDLHDKLSKSGHWSPFEHVAMALNVPEKHGNFIGWYQYRKMFPNEHIGDKML